MTVTTTLAYARLQW